MKSVPSSPAKASTSYHAPGDTTDAYVAIGATDIVTNGAFSSDANWTKETGWTIAGLKATKAAGVATDLIQDVYTEGGHTLVAGKTYVVVFTVTDYVAGECTPYVGGTTGAAVTATGTYVQCILSAALSDTVAIGANAAGDFSIDNVKVYDLTDPDGEYHVVDWISYSYEAAAPAGNLSIYGPDGQLFDLDIVTNAPVPPFQFSQGFHGNKGDALVVILAAPSADAGKLNVGYR